MNTVQQEKTAKKVTIAEVTEDEDMPDPLLFTDEAAAKVKSLIEEEDNDALMLRVFVSGGGCSGFQYGFTFDESITDGDTIVEKDGVKWI